MPKTIFTNEKPRNPFDPLAPHHSNLGRNSLFPQPQRGNRLLGHSSTGSCPHGRLSLPHRRPRFYFDHLAYGSPHAQSPQTTRRPSLPQLSIDDETVDRRAIRKRAPWSLAPPHPSTSRADTKTHPHLNQTAVHRLRSPHPKIPPLPYSPSAEPPQIPPPHP